MLKENSLITTEDIEKEIDRIKLWIEDCKYASKIDNVYALWDEKSDFHTLRLIFETTGMTAEKYEDLRRLADFELQKEIPLDVLFGNSDLLPGTEKIW